MFIISTVFDYHLKIDEIFEGIEIAILMQIFALEMTLVRGYNPDKPRNLAKSVTVK